MFPILERQASAGKQMRSPRADPFERSPLLDATGEAPTLEIRSDSQGTDGVSSRLLLGCFVVGVVATGVVSGVNHLVDLRDHLDQRCLDSL